MVMKKIISTLFLLFSFYVFSIIPLGNAESTGSNTRFVSESELELEKKLIALEKEIRVQNLIQYIEFESEIIVPDYIEPEYIEYAFDMAKKLEIPSRMAFRLIYKESCFVDTIVSPVGAKGLMQLMPETRKL
jgi:soluble lytic murein transglycosylase-like protein